MNLGKLAVRGVVGPLFVGPRHPEAVRLVRRPRPRGHGRLLRAGHRPAAGQAPRHRGGLSEAVGGALLTAGALTPLASSMIIGTMTTAIRKVHAPKGPWVTEGGWEYNARPHRGGRSRSPRPAPGKPSVDAPRSRSCKGTGWALAALAAGVAGSYLATGYFNKPAPAEPVASPAADEARFAREAAEAEARFQRESASAEAS